MYKWLYKPLDYGNAPVEEHCALLLPDIRVGTQRIRQAIDTGEVIFLFGDYDADGMDSTNILKRCIQEIGGTVRAYIPERREGYGMNEKQVNLAHSLGSTLIITIDNGSNAYSAINRAHELGIDVIIIDHHIIKDEAKINVVAHINQQRSDSQYPEKEVCATLLAWKISCLLYDYYGFPEGYGRKFLDYVAIATVGDVMPIVGENRKLVIDGIKKMNEEPSYHVRVMSNAMGVREIDIKTLGWNFAPAINSASRMGEASTSFEMLNANSKDEIKRLVSTVVDANNQRKTLVNDALVNLTLSHPDFPLVYYHSPDLNMGILGNIASKIVDKYKRPTLVSCLNEDGKIKGSARSVCEFPLYDFVMSLPEHFFISRGGHNEALGFELNPMHHNEFIDYFYNHTKPVVKEFVIYYNDTLTNIEEQYRKVTEGEPYGQGYERPLFKCDYYEVITKKFFSDSGKVYGSGMFNGKVYPFTSKLDYASKGDKIRGIVDFELTKAGEIRLVFEDYEII